MPDPSSPFLTERQLATRWHLSQRTLQRWRKLRTGPAWLKLGGRVVYAIDEIRNYETRAWEQGAA